MVVRHPETAVTQCLRDWPGLDPADPGQDHRGRRRRAGDGGGVDALGVPERELGIGQPGVAFGEIAGRLIPAQRGENSWQRNSPGELLDDFHHIAPAVKQRQQRDRLFALNQIVLFLGDEKDLLMVDHFSVKVALSRGRSIRPLLFACPVRRHGTNANSTSESPLFRAGQTSVRAAYARPENLRMPGLYLRRRYSMIMTWVRGRCWRRFSRTGTPGGFRDARMPGGQRVS